MRSYCRGEHCSSVFLSRVQREMSPSATEWLRPAHHYISSSTAHLARSPFPVRGRLSGDSAGVPKREHSERLGFACFAPTKEMSAQYGNGFAHLDESSASTLKNLM